ncbi:MAG: P1 family peptidase, partial [Chloroflexi bacterium]|nr:P1 family peptidase [Chloroflexota bacterium]
MPNETLTAIPGIRVGHWTDVDAATGCTVVLMPREGAIGGVEVRGAAPGTRETDLMRPGTLVQRVHAILLGGGSAFGLAAADGVMRFLEEAGIGFPTRAGVVPIVPAAILFDLPLGRADVRPRSEDGYAACVAASDTPVQQGSVGAGTGATVAKVLGMPRAIKGGLGSATKPISGGFTVGALMAVNAFGDVIDPETAQVIAGPRRDDGGFEDSREILWREGGPANQTTKTGPQGEPPGPATNTTIGIVATDVPLTVEQANRVAIMAHSGIARAIRPSYGMGDGDTLFVVSTAPSGTTA